MWLSGSWVVISSGLFCYGVDVDQGARGPNASTCIGESGPEVQEMHDVIGSAGMLRGWIALLTYGLTLFTATMTLTVGAVAIAELLITSRSNRALARITAATDRPPA
jgi:hypothetical protein